MGRLLREPLLHFTILALLIFGVYAAVSPESTDRPAAAIVVSANKIEQIAAVFERTWQRPPGPEEMKALIDDYVKEEILVREALALGLDQDDTVIRRRLRQKLEFLAASEVEAISPGESDLEAFLADHADRFAIEPRYAFQQVFFSPDRRGDAVEADARALLDSLSRSDAAATDPTMLGDASLLPAMMEPTALSAIASTYGAEFAAAIEGAVGDAWTGPVASVYGVHLIRVVGRVEGRVPALDEVRDAVQREWTNARAKELEAARMSALLERYRVTIEPAPPSSGTP